MDALKTIKSYPFSGKKKDCKMWQIRFKAYLTYHKCVDIITDENYNALTEATVLDPTESVHSQKAKQDQNIRAFMIITLAMSDAASFEAVDSRKSDDLPDGDAKLAWKTLTNIF
jgi:hypothetical protein